MIEHEDTARKARQNRALTTRSGAVIETEYRSRTTKVVGVNESDLRDLLSLDAVELALLGFGQFMAAGALWLFLDKYMDADFEWNALTGFCAASFLFGGALAAAGIAMRSMKRNRIRRIFDETTPAA